MKYVEGHIRKGQTGLEVVTTEEVIHVAHSDEVPEVLEFLIKNFYSEVVDWAKRKFGMWDRFEMELPLNDRNIVLGDSQVPDM